MSGLTQGAGRWADRLGATGPTVVVDQRRARRNLERMTAKAAAHDLRLRPHFKTHQSLTIGRWFAEAGVEAITVSSLAMARRFADDGWNDITVAFSFNPREIETAVALAARVDLGLLVDGPDQVRVLSGAPLSCGVWIKIDTGYHRSGVPWDATQPLWELGALIAASPGLELRGLLTHAGHSYRAGSPERILEIHAETLARMSTAREIVEAIAPPEANAIRISIGDTPCCSLAEDFTGVDEIRPGNFIFYDLMQRALATCADEDLAAGLLCPVVGKTEQSGRLLLHGGAVHLSAESLADEQYGRIFGRAALMDAKGFGAVQADTALVGLSQEHGQLQVEAEAFREARVGDMVLVLPVHSCLMADLHRHSEFAFIGPDGP